MSKPLGKILVKYLFCSSNIMHACCNGFLGEQRKIKKYFLSAPCSFQFDDINV